MKTDETNRNDDGKLSRRQLLMTGVGLLGASFAPASDSLFARNPLSPSPANETVIGMKFEPRDVVRVGIIGTGRRGTGMLSNFLAIPHVQISALCDSVHDHATNAQQIAEKSSGKRPEIYTKGEHDFENLCKRNDLDFIYIATPWDCHSPQALAAMKGGAHVGVEVPGVNTLEDAQQLVDTSEETRRHCMIMENCCYGSSELLVLNMIRAGLFGELLHAECAYIHDLRAILFEDQSEGLWRRLPHTKRNGNLYPTHGLGPVASYMGINRGDRFDYLVSMSSPQKGLDDYRAAKIPKNTPKWNEKFICGDMNTSLIKTVNGLTIMVQHDVTNPQPYDRINLIKGVKGLFRGYPERIYLEGRNPEDAFTGLDQYKETYEHALWKNQGKVAEGRGHGGMDYLMFYRLIQCIRDGLEPDMDVYDLASWSAVAELSEKSVAQGGMPVKLPDFTRGLWKQRNGSPL
jgi:hypothetical protein